MDKTKQKWIHMRLIGYLEDGWPRVRCEYEIDGIGEYRDFDVIPIKKNSIEEAKDYVWDVYVASVLEMFDTSDQHRKQ